MELLQEAEHGRRIAAGGRDLAGREADLALRHREAGEAVHQEVDVRSAVAEPLGDPGRDERRPEANERRLVRGRHDHDGPSEALGSEVVLDEFAHLTAAFADEGEDRDVGVGAADDHR